MSKKILESVNEVEYAFLVVDLEDNHVNNDAPYSMTKISLIPSDHSEVDIV